LKENKKILLASSNKGKINEFKDIFNDYEIIAQSELGISDAVEDGLTFFENALKKARHGAEHSGLFTIADDSGLVVPGLNYEPGIYSARYAGNNSSDLDNRNKIIDELNKLNLLTLPAYYVCVLVGINSPTDPMPIISSGKIHGEVSIKSSGSEGFGYDKIFYPGGLEISMASIDAEVKNNISHRAIATQLFLKELEESNS
jgi:XTP/dITP diphosphohydrolase